MKQYIIRLMLKYLRKEGYVLHSPLDAALDGAERLAEGLKLLRQDIEVYNTQKPANVSAPDLVYSKGF